MILPSFKDFPRNGRLLGIDWGARRIGVAVSDESRGFVFARDAIESAKCKVQSAISELIKDEKIVGIVVGLPLHLDGTDSQTTVRVRKFADDLAVAVDVPIVFIEENLTSVQAAEYTKTNIDSESAKIILENAIAMIKRHNNG